MKNHISKTAILAMVCFLSVACQREIPEDATEAAFLAGEEAGWAGELFESAENEAANKTETNTSNTAIDECAAVTWAQPKGTWPNVITIDFGDGCEDRHGRIRKGKIIVEVSDYWKNSGAVRKITTDNLSIDEVEIEGTRTISNLGLNENGRYEFEIVMTGSRVKAGDKTVSMEINHLAVMTEGYSTEETEDDVFSVTGTGSGINHRGNSFTSEITEPLIRKRSCPWFVSGVTEITSGKRSHTLDFGDGSCDEFAIITGPRGSKTIELRR